MILMIVIFLSVAYFKQCLAFFKYQSATIARLKKKFHFCRVQSSIVSHCYGPPSSLCFLSSSQQTHLFYNRVHTHASPYAHTHIDTYTYTSTHTYTQSHSSLSLEIYKKHKHYSQTWERLAQRNLYLLVRQKVLKL